ncbi:MAG TPA: chemotaxis protein CheW [Rhizomicrobium sp.]|nr:chemotaxis protein CheW [Rhizomicrobium sp.]
MHSAASSSLCSAGPVPREALVCRVRDQEFCIDVTLVKEIRGWAPTALLPHAPSYVRGVINLRGTVLPIVDMAARLDFPETVTSRHSVVIVVWIGKKQIGLLVDAVCDIVEVEEGSLQPTPQLSNDAVQALLLGLINAGDRVIGLLGLDQLLPEIEAGEP